MITGKMDARSQIAHVAALIVRIATWLREKAPMLPDRIIFRHDYSIIPCDALAGAGPKRCPRRCRPRARWHADGLRNPARMSASAPGRSLPSLGRPAPRQPQPI